MKEFIALMIVGAAIMMVLYTITGEAIDIEFEMQDRITNHYIGKI